MSNWKYILGIINLLFLLMEWTITPFIPFFVPNLGIRAGVFVFFGCILLTVGFNVFIILRKLNIKITPIKDPSKDPGAAIYIFLIIGWIFCFTGISVSWIITNIYISMLALIFWLGHIISWTLLWNSIKKIEEKR